MVRGGEMYKRKYRKGKKIVSLSALKHFLDKDNFVYINHKILHKGWVLSLQFRYLIYVIDREQITRAIKTSN